MHVHHRVALCHKPLRACDQRKPCSSAGMVCAVTDAACAPSPTSNLNMKVTRHFATAQLHVVCSSVGTPHISACPVKTPICCNGVRPGRAASVQHDDSMGDRKLHFEGTPPAQQLQSYTQHPTSSLRHAGDVRGCIRQGSGAVRRDSAAPRPSSTLGPRTLTKSEPPAGHVKPSSS